MLSNRAENSGCQDKSGVFIKMSGWEQPGATRYLGTKAVARVINHDGSFRHKVAGL